MPTRQPEGRSPSADATSSGSGAAGAGRAVRTALGHLIEPPACVEDPRTRRQLRLLLAVLAVLVPLALLLVLGLDLVQEEPVDLAAPDELLGVAATLGLLAVYVVARTGRYLAASSLTVALILGTLWGFALLDPVDASGVLIYLILPVFLAGLLIGPRATAVVAGLALGSVALDVFPHRALGTVDLFAFLAVHIAVIALATYLRGKDLDRIEAQAETLQEREEHLRQAQGIADMGSWTWDVATGDVELSEGLLKVFGADPGTAEPDLSGFLERVHPDDRDRIARMTEDDWLTRDGFEVETRIVRDDTGESRDVVLTGHVERADDGTPLKVVGTTQDVTEQRRVEQEARQAAETRARLEELGHLVELASHSLTEPLRNIVSYVQLLEKRYGDVLDEEGREHVATVSGAARRMKALIGDFVTFSEVAASPLDRQVVDAGEAARSALADLEDLRTATGADVRLDDDVPMVLADPDQLRTVFRELLENAMTFAADGAPAVEVGHRVSEDDDRVVLHVADDGPGIAPRHHDRVFELFQRLDRRDDDGGTGLGLALCKRIVEHHGGEIRIESDGVRGTTVRFSLPAA